MKNFTTALFFCIVLFTTQNAKAQCIPDPNLTYNGISPETLPNAMAGYYYSSVLSFKIPRDSSISGINVTIDSAQFLYAAGKPNGYTFACDKPECVWAGGTKGCALFSGFVDSTYTDSTLEYPMRIYTLTYYRFTGGADQFTRIDSATNYVFRILKYNGIGELTTYTHLTVYPNPTKDIINIELRDIQSNNNEILVIDALGKIVYQQTFERPSQFLSSYAVNMNSYSPGLYSVTLKSGAKIGYSKVMVR